MYDPSDEPLVVFVSSTGSGHLEDLALDRDVVSRAVQTSGCSVWRWEDVTSQPNPPHDVYLAGVRKSDIFVLVLGKDITTAVKDEYHEASANPMRPILVFVKSDFAGQKPASRMSAEAKRFLQEIMNSRTYAVYVDLEELRDKVVAALRTEVSRAARAYWHSPAARKKTEGADKVVLLLGCGELGTEVARSLRRFSGNRVVLAGIDRYRTPPARDELHEFKLLGEPWTHDALLDMITHLDTKPDTVLPELMAVPPGSYQALQDLGYHIVPCAEVTERLIDRARYRRELDQFLTARPEIARRLAQLDVRLPRWKPVATADEFAAAVTDWGKALLKPATTDLGLGQSLVSMAGTARQTRDRVNDAWAALKGARCADCGIPIAEECIDAEDEIYQVVVIGRDGTTVMPGAIEYRRTATDSDLIGGPWQLEYAVQPPILASLSSRQRTRLLRRVCEASELLAREWLGVEGFFGFEYLQSSGAVWLNKITLRPDINGIVTAYGMQPSLFDLYAKLALGQRLPTEFHVRPTACFPAVWPDVRNLEGRFAVVNAEDLRATGVEVIPIDKHEMNGRDRVALIIAHGSTSLLALEHAREASDKANIKEAP